MKKDIIESIIDVGSGKFYFNHTNTIINFSFVLQIHTNQNEKIHPRTIHPTILDSIGIALIFTVGLYD